MVPGNTLWIFLCLFFFYLFVRVISNYWNQIFHWDWILLFQLCTKCLLRVKENINLNVPQCPQSGTSYCKLCFIQSGDLKLIQHPGHHFSLSLQNFLKFPSTEKKNSQVWKTQQDKFAFQAIITSQLADYESKIFTIQHLNRYQLSLFNKIPRDCDLIQNKFYFQKQYQETMPFLLFLLLSSIN